MHSIFDSQILVVVFSVCCRQLFVFNRPFYRKYIHIRFINEKNTTKECNTNRVDESEEMCSQKPSGMLTNSLRTFDFIANKQYASETMSNSL